MDVLTPRTLDEALRLKAERPDAVPIQGGTDVMVELNFDRARPSALLNLSEVAELRGWSRENGTIRLGAALTYTEAMEMPLAEALPALADGELIVGVRVRAADGPQTFMKVGPRNAMVISVVSLALTVDRDGGEIRAAFGSAGPVVGLVTAPLAELDGFPERVSAAASPIDDVRGSAAYRRHSLRVLTERALERCLQ